MNNDTELNTLNLEEQLSRRPHLSKYRCSKMTIFELADYVIAETSDCGLRTERLSYVREALGVLATRFDVTEMGAFFLCWMFNYSDDPHLTVRDLATQLGCTNISILRYGAEIEFLRDKGYIRIGLDSGGVFFQVPAKVMEAARENRIYEPPGYNNLTEDMFLSRLCENSIGFIRGFLTGRRYMQELGMLMDANPTLHCVEALTKLPETPAVRGLLALTMAAHLRGDDQMGMEDIANIFESEHDKAECQRWLMLNIHPLQALGLIEPACFNGHVAGGYWQLTSSACNEIFRMATVANQTRNQALTQPDSIVPKKLYFCPEMESELAKLRNLLSQDRLPEVQRRLEESGMRRGVTCIFYGKPGTGKTESVLQIARETGRAIMQVDISQMRDKYVGESEKKIKGIFAHYRDLCRNNTVMPILLFNEADALFTRRNAQASQSVDKMENAMQNIILEEMEKLDGILIATTNLVQSMDTAFERRFLYKVDFQTPRPEESRHIWSEMVKDLSEEDAYSLAREFRFSGGQIENIARKRIIASLLDDEPIRMDGLREFCRREQFKYDTHSPIGFS